MAMTLHISSKDTSLIKRIKERFPRLIIETVEIDGDILWLDAIESLEDLQMFNEILNMALES